MHIGAISAVRVKTCTQCKAEKKLPDDFNKHKGHKDGFYSQCRSCCKLNYDTHAEERRATARTSYRKHSEENNAYSRAYWGKLLRDKPELMLWRKAKERARTRNLPFTIEPNDLKIPEVCPVLGIPLFHGKGKWSDNSPTVDRKIPVLGYVKDNVRVISWRANDLKKDGTLEEFRKLIAYLEEG